VLEDAGVQREEHVLIELLGVVARRDAPPQVVPDLLVVRGEDVVEQLAQEGGFLGRELGASPWKLGDLRLALGFGRSGALAGVGRMVVLVLVSGHGKSSRVQCRVPTCRGGGQETKRPA